MRHPHVLVPLVLSVACAHEPLDLKGISKTEIEVAPNIFDARTAGNEDGELVLLLHGFPQTSVAWRGQLQALGEAGYFAVAPDQKGYSPRARPKELDAYRFDSLVADVLAFADALGRDRFHLVGHDWGGSVAWGVAAAAPERLLSLTIVSIPHPDAYRAELAIEGSCQHEASGYVEPFTEEGFEEVLLGFGAFGLRNLVYRGLEPAAIEAYLDVLGEPEAMAAALNWYRANLDGRRVKGDELGAVDVDTLFVWGDEDAYLCAEPAAATVKYVEGSYRPEVLAGVDHWVPENASEKLNELLLAHVRAHADADSSSGGRAIATDGGEAP